MIQVAHIFYDTHMGYAHHGLKQLMHAALKKEEPDADEVVLFINRSWTAAKLFVAGNTFLYHRATSKKLTIEHIRQLPESFGGEPLRFSKELATALLKRLEKAKKEAA